eukprot:TRINITY_DN19623_c0_g1_i1.p1 TRINITY_DN19623_c0_g1~~TRINITY_DN19623_c0_g1_i1.p1  ORF type:complete len:241 (+),score=60.80 TRINITY_DN19623_c0_g1_i1:76-723(+)
MGPPARLRDTNTMVLFHQTSEQSAAAIRQSGQMRRGGGGLAGGGIYFALTPEDTAHKAHQKGVVLRCRVHLGRIKRLEAHGDPGITFSSLQREGFDSVCVPRHPGGNEYVVYNYDQVELLGPAEPHQPASCRFEYVPLSTRVWTLADGVETTWEHLKAVSRERRTSGGLGPGARYFRTVSRGPELFAFFRGEFYYHDKDRWHKYISARAKYMSGP